MEQSVGQNITAGQLARSPPLILKSFALTHTHELFYFYYLFLYFQKDITKSLCFLFHCHPIFFLTLKKQYNWAVFGSMMELYWGHFYHTSSFFDSVDFFLTRRVWQMNIRVKYVHLIRYKWIFLFINKIIEKLT